MRQDTERRRTRAELQVVWRRTFPDDMVTRAVYERPDPGLPRTVILVDARDEQQRFLWQDHLRRLLWASLLDRSR